MLYCIALCCTVLNCTALRCTALHCSLLQYRTVQYQSIRLYGALHCTTLTCNKVHYFTLDMLNAMLKHFVAREGPQLVTQIDHSESSLLLHIEQDFEVVELYFTFEFYIN